MKVEKAKLHLQTGNYQFIEFEIPEIDTIEKAQELQKTLIEKDMKDSYNFV